MNSLFFSILSCRELEYIILDRNFKILESSCHAKQFSEFPEEINIGNDIRLALPELCGSEETIESIIQGTCQNFKLNSIAKTNPQSTSAYYVDLYIGLIPAETEAERNIILLLEDTTEQMIVQQQLFQRVNEASLLKTAWSESQAYLDKIINSMADSLLVTNGKGIIKKINPAAREMFGYEENELLNHSILILLSQSEKLPITDLPPEVWNDDFSLIYEVNCITKSRQEIVVSFSCSQLPTKLMEMPDLVYLGKDITQRVQAEKKLRQVLEKEKELNQFKSQFISSLSHEIRTPLNTILLASELLRNIENPEQDEILVSIQSNIRNLMQVIEDVLLVSQTDNFELSLSEGWVDITDFCQKLVAEIQLGLGDSQRLQFFGNDRIEAQVDLKILRYILKKIIYSIIKYSSSNIEIQVKLDRSHQEILFDIFDPSCYLPQEDRENLLKANPISKISGIALELAIVQKSVESHGGRIELESEIKVGTVFRVVLPWQSHTINHR
jgi:PAS domain S-box-containing protein